MSSPVGHALVGVGLAALSVPLLDVRPGPALWVGAVIASSVPDLDFLGVLLGYPQDRVHRQGTHALPVLGLVAGLTLWAARELVSWLDTRTVWAWALALLSHPFVDALTTTIEPARANVGIPLFWPFSTRRYYLPRPLARPPTLASYTSASLLRDLLPELALFGTTCLSLVLLGSLL